MQAIAQVQHAGAPISRVPLIKALADRPPPELLPDKRTKRAGTQKANALEVDSASFVTPVIGRVVMQHVNSQVSVVGAEMAEAQEKLADELNEVLEHHNDPESMRWAERLDDLGGFSSVLMDGVKYKVCDSSVHPSVPHKSSDRRCGSCGTWEGRQWR